MAMSTHDFSSCLKALRIAGWLCVGLLVWLSWIPAFMEVRTGIVTGQIEHTLAYAGTGAILAFAYRATRRGLCAGALVALGGILEVGQLWVPGRTSQVIDFAASGAGAVAGVLAGSALFRLLSNRLVQPSA